jgi:hypothetical protein
MNNLSTIQALFAEFWNWNPSAPSAELGQRVTPLTNMLTSPINRLGWRGEQFVKRGFDGNPKHNTVEVFFPPYSVSQSDPELVEFCEAGTALPMLKKLIAPEMVTAAHKVAFDGACDYKTIIEGGQSYEAGMLAAAYKDIAEQTEKGVAEGIYTLKGKFGADVRNTRGGLFNIKDVATYKDAAETYVGSQLLRIIAQDSELTNYRNAPVILGFGLVWDYFMDLNSQSLDATGFDVDKYLAEYGFAFLKTKYANEWVTGTELNPFLTYDPGSVQIIEYSCFDGNEVIKGDKHQYAVVNPIDGLLVDVFETNVCTEAGIKTTFTMKRNIGLVGLPDNLYNGSDYAGATGVNLYNVINPS